MDLRSERYADVVVLQPAGRIDHTNAEAFSRALAPHLETCKAGGDQLLFDLAGLDYISSAGLRELMLAAKRSQPLGGHIALAAPQPVVREILEISRFNLVFPMHAGLGEGLNALSAAAADLYAKG
jgi:anti-anti-sigma factor